VAGDGECPLIGVQGLGVQTEWGYEKHGYDWPEKYPDCALPQQSPINLLAPRTKYGRAYDIYTYEEDNHEPTYPDVEATFVNFNPLRYTVEVLLGGEDRTKFRGF